MEDALAHVSEGVMVYRSSVLILVVMEDALAPEVVFLKKLIF